MWFQGKETYVKLATTGSLLTLSSVIIWLSLEPSSSNWPPRASSIRLVANEARCPWDDFTCAAASNFQQGLVGLAFFRSHAGSDSGCRWVQNSDKREKHWKKNNVGKLATKNWCPNLSNDAFLKLTQQSCNSARPDNVHFKPWNKNLKIFVSMQIQKQENKKGTPLKLLNMSIRVYQYSSWPHSSPDCPHNFDALGTGSMAIMISPGSSNWVMTMKMPSTGT